MKSDENDCVKMLAFVSCQPLTLTTFLSASRRNKLLPRAQCQAPRAIAADRPRTYVSDSFNYSDDTSKNNVPKPFPVSSAISQGNNIPNDDPPSAPGWCFGEQSVHAALEAIRQGDFIVVVDDENRENEGDLICAASTITTKQTAFMVKYTSGVLCCAMPSDRLSKLALGPMVPENTDPKGTAFTVTCDLAKGVSTGISARDRSMTLRALASDEKTATDFNKPGHIFPLAYREGGVLRRAGHTEAAVDFCRMAGMGEVGVLAEVVDGEDVEGGMLRLQGLKKFAKEHGLVLTSIADLVMWRRMRERLVERIGLGPARLPTRYGEFDAYAYKGLLDGVEHLALVKGGDFGKEPVLVRVHSECCTGDVFGSLRCDCGNQLEYGMRRIAEEGRGIVVYLRGQEGRGIGLGHKMRAYALQDRGRDTVEANEELGFPVDSREYGIGAQILADLGVRELRVMTNNPKKYSGLTGYGLKIVERVPVQVIPNPENLNYLRTKMTKMGHWIKLEDTDDHQSLRRSSDLPTGLR